MYELKKQRPQKWYFDNYIYFWIDFADRIEDMPRNHSKSNMQSKSRIQSKSFVVQKFP